MGAVGRPVGVARIGTEKWGWAMCPGPTAKALHGGGSWGVCGECGRLEAWMADGSKVWEPGGGEREVREVGSRPHRAGEAAAERQRSGSGTAAEIGVAIMLPSGGCPLVCSVGPYWRHAHAALAGRRRRRCGHGDPARRRRGRVRSAATATRAGACGSRWGTHSPSPGEQAGRGVRKWGLVTRQRLAVRRLAWGWRLLRSDQHSYTPRTTEEVMRPRRVGWALFLYTSTAVAVAANPEWPAKAAYPPPPPLDAV